MDDAEFLKKTIAQKKEAIEFFNGRHKANRERATVEAFLRCLGVQFEKADITQPPGQFPDALFGDAAFEVKEVLDQGRTRDAEYKADLAGLESAQDASALIEPYQPPEPITLDALAAAIDSEMSRYSKYSPETKRATDLLVYFNRQFVSIDAGAPLFAEVELGWRSISVVGNGWAIVLSAGVAAPRFIAAQRGRLVRNPQSWG